MPKMLKSFTYLFIVLMLFGCSDTFRTERFYAMGTFVSITLPEKDFDKAQDIRAEISRLEKRVTESTDIVNKSQKFLMTGVMNELYQIGEQFSEISDGRFSIFAYTIASIYGFHKGPYRTPSDDEIATAVAKIKTKSDVLMDMGAYAKGYIVDRAIDKAKSMGIKKIMINAGGDLYAMGDKGNRDWRVAVKHPTSEDSVLAVLNLKDKALATSGDYERFFYNDNGVRVYHIFDATTGQNPLFYNSVSVVADDTATADGLATVFFLLPMERVKELCEEMGTPTLLFRNGKEPVKLCGWEQIEDN